MRRIAILLAAAAACGGETGPAGDTFALESARAVTATIGPDGGELAATDSRGRSYILAIPPLALAQPVAITLTPVASYPAVAGADVLAAAHFAPEGLEFARPAMLRITGLDPVLAARPAGFTYAGNAANPVPAIAAGATGTFVAQVLHFSGIGVIADVLELEPDGQSAAAVEAWLEVDAAARGADWEADLDAAYSPIAAALERWYRDVVAPELAEADTDRELTNALGGYSAWVHVVTCGADTSCPPETGNLHLWPEGVGFLLQQQFGPLLTTAAVAAAEAVTRGIDRSIATCREDRDLAAAAQSLYWTKLAIVMSGEHPDDPVGECVAVELSDLDFPAAIAPGVPAELSLVAGLSFAGAPSQHDRNLQVLVSASDAAPATASGVTATGTGAWSAVFTPDGDAPVVLGIRVRWGEIGLEEVLKLDTLVERNLGVAVTLTPGAAILDRGAEAQFTATVAGTTTTGVTWTASGGTFSVAGNVLTYRAGTTPGSYAVTATSVADPTRSATATIEIVASSAFEFLGVLPVSAGVGVGTCAQGELLQGLGTSRLTYTSPLWLCTGGDPVTTTASANVNFAVSSISSLPMTIASSGSTSAVVGFEWPGSGQVNAGFRFRISGRSVGYRLEGSLAGSGLEGSARLFLTGTFDLEEIANGVTGARTIDRTGTLPPGEYSLLLSASTHSGGPTDTGSGSFNVTLTIGP